MRDLSLLLNSNYEARLSQILSAEPGPGDCSNIEGAGYQVPVTIGVHAPSLEETARLLVLMMNDVGGCDSRLSAAIG